MFDLVIMFKRRAYFTDSNINLCICVYVYSLRTRSLIEFSNLPAPGVAQRMETYMKLALHIDLQQKHRFKWLKLPDGTSNRSQKPSPVGSYSVLTAVEYWR